MFHELADMHLTCGAARWSVQATARLHEKHYSSRRILDHKHFFFVYHVNSMKLGHLGVKCAIEERADWHDYLCRESTVCQWTSMYQHTRFAYRFGVSQPIMYRILQGVHLGMLFTCKEFGYFKHTIIIIVWNFVNATCRKLLWIPIFSVSPFHRWSFLNSWRCFQCTHITSVSIWQNASYERGCAQQSFTLNVWMGSLVTTCWNRTYNHPDWAAQNILLFWKQFYQLFRAMVF